MVLQDPQQSFQVTPVSEFCHKCFPGKYTTRLIHEPYINTIVNKLSIEWHPRFKFYYQFYHFKQTNIAKSIVHDAASSRCCSIFLLLEHISELEDICILYNPETSNNKVYRYIHITNFNCIPKYELLCDPKLCLLSILLYIPIALMLNSMAPNDNAV